VLQGTLFIIKRLGEWTVLFNLRYWMGKVGKWKGYQSQPQIRRYTYNGHINMTTIVYIHVFIVYYFVIKKNYM